MRVDSTVAMRIAEWREHQPSWRRTTEWVGVEECAARRAGTPRDEKKLGLRIESVAWATNM
jgi:hypothetical protein